MSDTLFLIHGMWGGRGYWDNYRTFFEAQGFHCLSPILRYHDIDPSDPPDPRLGTTSLLDYAADLEDDIRQLPDKPVIIGHSMGGLLAQILGARDLGKAIVLLAPASPAGIQAMRFSVMKSFWSSFSRWGFWKKPNRPTFNEAAYAVLHLMSPEAQKEEYAKYVYESGRAASEIGFWLFDRKKAAAVDASRIDVPLLVVSGAEDRITPAAINRKVADKYHHVSTYQSFPGHAHWVLGEPGWEEIAGFVADWIKTCGA